MKKVSPASPAPAAKDEGLFEAGIDMEFVRALNSGRVSPTENEVNPILGHVAFEEAQVAIYRA